MSDNDRLDCSDMDQATDSYLERIRQLQSQLAEARKTNERLNRRCQKAESALANNDYWADGFERGRNSSRKDDDRFWQSTAQKHGEKNARLQKQLAERDAEIAALRDAIKIHNEKMDNLPKFDGHPGSAAIGLRILANWFDALYPDDKEAQVQDDLRRWADESDAKDAEIERLPKLVGNVCDRRELEPCWFNGQTGDSDDDGDCGNWPECHPDCPLAQLREMAGYIPQEDGGMDKQPTAETVKDKGAKTVDNGHGIKIFKDGDRWCAVMDDFINIQESLAGFGSTSMEALDSLAADLASHCKCPDRSSSCKACGDYYKLTGYILERNKL